MHFLIVIYMACNSLANWWWLFLGTSHFDLDWWQKYPPAGICGGAFLPEITVFQSASNRESYLAHDDSSFSVTSE